MADKYTSVTFGSFDRQRAEALRDKLRAMMANSFLQPCEIGAAPIGGSFEVFLTTRYVFADDGEVDDNEKLLMDHMLYVLACML